MVKGDSMKKYIAFLRGINIRMLYFGLLIDSNIKNVIGGKKLQLMKLQID